MRSCCKLASSLRRCGIYHHGQRSDLEISRKVARTSYSVGLARVYLLCGLALHAKYAEAMNTHASGPAREPPHQYPKQRPTQCGLASGISRPQHKNHGNRERPMRPSDDMVRGKNWSIQNPYDEYGVLTAIVLARRQHAGLKFAGCLFWHHRLL